MSDWRTLFALIVASQLIGHATAHDLDATNGPARPSDVAVGSVHFTNSCSEAVQPIFNRGVAMLHSFWFSAAIDTFDEVLASDPGCAMAEWGKALSHWGNPLGSTRAKALLRSGAESAARARTLRIGNSRERDYIEAVAALYENFENTPDRSRALAYEKAMERLAERYPNDGEAAIFFALALNGTADLTDKSYAQLLRAAKILEGEFETQPNHPGIAHYIIHSYDVPSLAKHALPAARQYAGLAPAAPHALHMPSHTFTRLGHWQESIETNLRSADSALAAGSPAEALHAIDYMVYAYLQTAQDDAAKREMRRTAEVFGQVASGNRYSVVGAFAAAAVPTRIALEREDWAAATRILAVESSAPFVDAIVHLAHGLGGVHLNDLEMARAAVASLKIAEEKLSENPYWAGQVAIQRTIVEAWLMLAEGNNANALTRMREAVVLEDATEKAAISPGPLAPASEQLGEMLLEMGLPAEALVSFEKAIEKEPGRFRGLYGAGIAADATGQTQLAREYFTRLVNVCAKADSERPQLVRARTYLKRPVN